MRIGKLAESAGVTIDTIRFYEKRGLLGKEHFRRGANGYREYEASAQKQIAMIQQARSAGFTLSETAELLSLWTRGELGDAAIVAQLKEKQSQVVAKIADLEKLRSYLAEKIARMTPTVAV